jgi:hypothetical protein
VTPSAALADRRQRAREAAFDEPAWQLASADEVNRIAAAIETATRVQITPGLIAAARQIATEQMHDPQAPTDPAERWKVILTAAFRAAGFEVEQ